MSEPARPRLIPAPGTPGHARLIYWGFLLGLVLPGMNVISAGLAALARKQADAITAAHYHNQLSLFTKSVVYVLTGLVFTYFLFGVVIIMAVIIWYILRVRKGLQALKSGAPPVNPDSWTF
jgi:uncharacterized membrane protein